MKKSTRYLVYLALAAVLAIALYLYRTLQLGRSNAQPAFLEILNPGGEMTGPEGILFDGSGNLFVGDNLGILWILEHGAGPRPYADLSQLPAGLPAAGPVHLGGLALDAQGNIYAACFEFAGGSILRIDAGTKTPSLFARDIGVANGIITGRDGRYLWASDCRRRGRLLRYPLNGPLPAKPDLVVEGLEYPNGLVFGKDDRVLYAAETRSGNIAAVDLAGAGPRTTRLFNLKGSFAAGSLDGLAFDPRDGARRFLYVAQNLRGLITVVDLQAQPIRILKSFRLALMGGRPCPASMELRDGYLYFSDYWACSPLRILLGMPKWHNHAYRFRVADLTLLYAGETN